MRILLVGLVIMVASWRRCAGWHGKDRASGPRAVSMGRVRAEALTGWEAWAGSSLR